MQDEQLPTIPDNQEPQENEKPALRTISKKLTRRHKAFSDRYLVNGMNATEAYRHVFKPKIAESAHANAYRVMALEGVKEYIERRLIELNDASYHPEAIKSALAERAVSSTRDSDKIRSLEIMAKIQGLLTEGTQTQVNVFTDDIMSLAKKRLADRKNLSNVNSIHEIEGSDADSLSSKCSETRGLTQSDSTQKLDIDSGSVGSTESVLSINKDGSASKVDTTASSDNGAGAEKDSPEGEGGRTPTQGRR